MKTRTSQYPLSAPSSLPSTPQPRFARHLVERLVLCALVISGVVGASIDVLAGPCSTPSIVIAEPIEGGTLQVSRIAAAHAGLPETWDMRYDAWFCNPNSSAITVSSVKIEHLNGANVTKTVNIPALWFDPSTAKVVSPAQVAAASTNQLVMVRDDAMYLFPLPTSIRITFTLSTRGTSANLVQTYSVAEHIDPGPLHAFFFPFRQSDLPSGAYWYQTRHEEDNTFQRWAYDLMVETWDGSGWTPLKPGTTGKHNVDFYTFDKPVYAMSDGRVIGCNRGAPDNEPGGTIGNVPGGNVLWVRTGNETQLYAHLKQNSIPYSLCPFTDDAQHKLADPDPRVIPDPAYVIHAGQLLAHTGESGSSQSGTHLHIHTFMGLPAIWGGSETGIDADARPLEFVNVRVQERAKADVDPATWNQVTSRALLPYNTRIEGNDCGFDPSAVVGKSEVVNFGVPGNCFLEMTNAMWQEDDRPTSIDVHGLGASSESSTVWRPAGGIANVLLAGLDDVGLDTAKQTWVVKNGFRIRQVEGYLEGAVMKHAVIFEKGTTGGAQLMQRNIDGNTLANLGTQNPGFVPVNISAVVVNGVTRFDALMEKKQVGSLVVKDAIPISEYQNEFDAESKAGRSLAYIDGYESGGSAFVSTIWYGGLPATAALHGQTLTQMQAAEAANLTAGRLMHGVTQYIYGGDIVYAGFWRSGP
ncbi:MAG: hypothetical protein WAN69_06185 [Candidatus Korobacteraceae bacterium]